MVDQISEIRAFYPESMCRKLELLTDQELEILTAIMGKYRCFNHITVDDLNRVLDILWYD